MNICKWTFEEAIQGKKTVKIDTSEMDREVAILLYKGKIYEDINHQYAFKSALEDEGEALDYDIEREHNRAINQTYELSKNNEIYTYSIYDDGEKQYCIAHFENHLKDGWFKIGEYISKHDVLFGYITENDEYLLFVG